MCNPKCRFWDCEECEPVVAPLEAPVAPPVQLPHQEQINLGIQRPIFFRRNGVEWFMCPYDNCHVGIYRGTGIRMWTHIMKCSGKWEA